MSPPIVSPAPPWSAPAPPASAAAPPGSETRAGRPRPVAGEQALLIEARRRGRRRRLTWTAVLLVAAALAAALAWPRLVPSAGRSRGGVSPAAVFPVGGPSSARVVWFDGAGRLHAGVIASGGEVIQRVVTRSNPAALPVVQAGGLVYWVDPAGTYVPSVGHWSQVVRYLDLATGRAGIAGPGQTVFGSADGRYLFTALAPWALTRIPASGGPPAQVPLPHGWYPPGGDGQADVVSGQGVSTANGIVLQSLASPGRNAPVLGLWKPGTSTVRVLGRGRAVIGAYTPPHGGYSLLAWLPASCPLHRNCLVDITNTATMSTRSVRSPLPGGFAMGGAFSPSGGSLAVFANAGRDLAVRLALVDTATGAVRLAAWPPLPVGQDIAWARWLPGGTRLIMGSVNGGYLVDAATLSARPLVASGGLGRPSGNPGVNYTVVVIPSGR